jgi:hypothetical protein
MREHLENVSRIMLARRLAQNTPPPAEPNLENSEAKPMLVGKIAHF